MVLYSVDSTVFGDYRLRSERERGFSRRRSLRRSRERRRPDGRCRRRLLV